MRRRLSSGDTPTGDALNEASLLIRERELVSFHESVRIRIQRYRTRILLALTLLTLAVVSVFAGNFLSTYAHIAAGKEAGLLGLSLLGVSGFVALVMSVGVEVTREDGAFERAFAALKMMENYTRTDSNISKKVLADIQKSLLGFPTDYGSSYGLINQSIEKPAETFEEIVSSRLNKEFVTDPSNANVVRLALQLMATYFMNPSVELLARVTSILTQLLPEAAPTKSKQTIFVGYVKQFYPIAPATGICFLVSVVIFAIDVKVFNSSGSDAFGIAAVVFATLVAACIFSFRKPKS